MKDKKETKVVLRAMIGMPLVNKFMKECDFGDKKYWGEVKDFTVTYKRGEKVTRDRLLKLLVSFMNSFPKTGKDLECIYCRIKEIETKLDISNLFLIKHGYEDVKIISDGKYETFLSKGLQDL